MWQSSNRCTSGEHEALPRRHGAQHDASGATGQDMQFDQGEIADSMLRVGFRSVRSRTLDTDGGPMDPDVGRKA